MQVQLLRCSAALVALVMLSACGSDETPPAAAPAPSESAAATAPAVAAPTPVEGAGSLEVAEAALRAQRLFTPAGDNAFELFILALEADPDSQQAKDALTDLFPYAVLHVEQRTTAREAEEARRVLDLMARSQPGAPALERLERELERLERRLATEAVAPPPSRPAAPPTPEPAPAPAPIQATPAPAPPPVAAPSTPPPQVPASTPPPVASPTPPPAAPPPAAASAAPRLPRVLRQPNVRYPESAMRQGIEGEVTVDFQIDADGGVSDVRVIESTPNGVFDREAVQVIRRTRFEAPPEPMRVRRTIEFNLQR